MRRPLISLLVLLAAVPSRAADPAPATLLEQAVYKEETAGDLGAAIQLYRRIVAAPEADRLVAARALYRLGDCLERKGEAAEARSIFERLVREHTEPADLVAKARSRLAPALMPAPWADGETLWFFHGD